MIKDEFKTVEVTLTINGDPITVEDSDQTDPRVGRIYYVYQKRQTDDNDKVMDDKHSKKVSLEEYKRRRRVTEDSHERREEDMSPSHMLVIDEDVLSDDDIKMVTDSTTGMGTRLMDTDSTAGMGTRLMVTDSTAGMEMRLMITDSTAGMGTRLMVTDSTAGIGTRLMVTDSTAEMGTRLTVTDSTAGMGTRLTVTDSTAGMGTRLTVTDSTAGMGTRLTVTDNTAGMGTRLSIHDSKRIDLVTTNELKERETVLDNDRVVDKGSSSSHDFTPTGSVSSRRKNRPVIIAEDAINSIKIIPSRNVQSYAAVPELKTLAYQSCHQLMNVKKRISMIQQQQQADGIVKKPRHDNVENNKKIIEEEDGTKVDDKHDNNDTKVDKHDKNNTKVDDIHSNKKLVVVESTDTITDTTQQPATASINMQQQHAQYTMCPHAVPIHHPIHQLPPSSAQLISPPMTMYGNPHHLHIRAPPHMHGGHPGHGGHHYPFQPDMVPHGPPPYPVYHSAPPIQGPHPWEPPLPSPHPLNPEEFRELATILQQGRDLQRSLRLRSRSRSSSRSSSRSRSFSRSRSYSKSCSHSRSPSPVSRKSQSFSRSRSPVRKSRSSSRYTHSPSSRVGVVSVGTQVGVATYNCGVQCRPKVNSVLSQTTFRSRNEYTQTTLNTKSRGIQTDSKPRSRATWTQTHLVNFSQGTQTDEYHHPSIDTLMNTKGKQLLGDIYDEKAVVIDWLEMKINSAENIVEDIESKLSPLSGCSHISEGNWSDDTPSSASPSGGSFNDTLNKTGDDEEDQKRSPIKGEGADGGNTTGQKQELKRDEQGVNSGSEDTAHEQEMKLFTSMDNTHEEEMEISSVNSETVIIEEFIEEMKLLTSVDITHEEEMEISSLDGGTVIEKYIEDIINEPALPSVPSLQSIVVNDNVAASNDDTMLANTSSENSGTANEQNKDTAASELPLADNDNDDMEISSTSIGTNDLTVFSEEEDVMEEGELPPSPVPPSPVSSEDLSPVVPREEDVPPSLASKPCYYYDRIKRYERLLDEQKCRSRSLSPFNKVLSCSERACHSSSPPVRELSLKISCRPTGNTSDDGVKKELKADKIKNKSPSSVKDEFVLNSVNNNNNNSNHVSNLFDLDNLKRRAREHIENKKKDGSPPLKKKSTVYPRPPLPSGPFPKVPSPPAPPEALNNSEKREKEVTNDKLNDTSDELASDTSDKEKLANDTSDKEKRMTTCSTINEKAAVTGLKISSLNSPSFSSTRCIPDPRYKWSKNQSSTSTLLPPTPPTPPPFDKWAGRQPCYYPIPHSYSLMPYDRRNVDSYEYNHHPRFSIPLVGRPLFVPAPNNCRPIERFPPRY